MKYKVIITAVLFWIATLPVMASAEINFKFVDLAQQSQQLGQITGSVKSCSNQFNPQGTIVHIPGVSVSTKLGDHPEFRLLSVPEGNYTLVFEYADQTLYTVKNVAVRSKTMTSIGAINLCPDNDADGYNLLADMDDTNSTVFPGAREVCDRVDNNGDGRVDEGCSYRKCPKGGKFCLNNWNNSKRIVRATQQPVRQPGRVEEAVPELTENLAK